MSAVLVLTLLGCGPGTEGDAALAGAEDGQASPELSIAVDFRDYDVFHVADGATGRGTFELRNGKGELKQRRGIVLGKPYPWLRAPLFATEAEPRTWYREYTYFVGAMNPCGAATDASELQVATRYVDPDGAVWELAGQRDVECGNNTIHVFADTSRSLAPIIIAPSPAVDRQTFLAEAWSTPTPNGGAPSGYPTSGAELDNHALSWATVTSSLPSFTVTVAGASKTYHDVVQVYWMHGGKYGGRFGQYPCGQDQNPALARFKAMLDRGYNVYVELRWYAKHDPASGQVGGLVKNELQYYCSILGDQPVAYGALLGQDTAQYRAW